MRDRPSLLIEDWLPITALGIESRRESEIASALPPIRFLHVWWARRPLVSCAGVILASLLPTWTESLAEQFPDELRVSDDETYRRWVLGLCGITGDPERAKRIVSEQKARGNRVVEKDIYGYERAYSNSPNPANLALLHEVLEWTWGELPSVIDPTAGGGSIPYTAARYGLPAIANDLNAVATAVLRAGVEVSAHEGRQLAEPLQKWGSILVERCGERLLPFFKLDNSQERIVGYISARSVVCPRTGKRVPLSPNWWLSKKRGQEVAVRVIIEREGVTLDEPEFKILRGSDAVSSNPDDGTVAGGNGISIWDGLPIDGDYIKAEAQAGRIGSILYGVAIRVPNSGGGRSRWTRSFRAPTNADRESIREAELELESRRPQWLSAGVIPKEDIGVSNYDRGHRLYGINSWVDFFSARQLLVHGTFVEEFRKLLPEILAEEGDSRGRTIGGVLAMMQGKALSHGSVQCRWDSTREKVVNIFDKHNFSWLWSFAEFDGARELFPWSLEQVVSAYDGIAALYEPGTAAYILKGETFRGKSEMLRHPVPGPVFVSRGTAADLGGVETGSQTLVCVDPPYYDNVMYAELSDFFGVWEQHTIGTVWPDLMPGGLADQTNEAVANSARFVDFGRRKNELATADYQAKMQAIFAECGRVLRDDGVMSVMFTHKRAEAWDTLGMALMESGFEIATSWPVNTESEQSIHQAKKNAAASTVMLVCRKRPAARREETFFEDLVPDIKTAAREALARFEKDGISGVDLLLSTYGPVLSVISAAWPVYSSEATADGRARLLRPEEALNVAREELVEARRRSIVGREVTFDPVTDFWLIAWELFQAEEFPYDEARRLALAVGGQDPEGLAAEGILKKKTGTVVLQTPADRRRRVLRSVQDGDFQSLSLVDILHGVLITADLDGLAAARTLMDRHGLTADARFLGLIQGAVNAIPRTKRNGTFIRPEAKTLDSLVVSYLPSIVVPSEMASDILFELD